MNEQQFIVHFGEMGSRWGLNRTLAQIFALIYISNEPYNAEMISDRLGVSRSNVSLAVKELRSWKLVRLFHLPGDRRDYFKTPDHVWEVVKTVIHERQQRELLPTLEFLEEELEDKSNYDEYARERMGEMRDLLQLFMSWSEDMQKVSPAVLERFMHLGSGILKVTSKTV